jgi:uncharacterized protein
MRVLLPDPPMTVVENLPPLSGQAADEERLDPRAVAVWRLGSLLGTAAVTAVAAVACLVLGVSPAWALAAAATGSVEAALWPQAAYRGWSYRVGGDDLRLRRGVLWRAESVVPLSRIQHVDTRQGPLDRALGLARVVVFTAGSVGARVEIPGLAAARAEALRDRLAALAGREDAV